MKKAILFIIMLSVIFTGCQKTPKESAVVRKTDGISETIVCKPLKEGEMRETDVPKHWKFEEK